MTTPILNSTTALAVVNINELTKNEFSKRNPNIKMSRPSFAPTRGSQSTFDAGYQEGRRLNINKPLGHAAQKGLPS